MGITVPRCLRLVLVLVFALGLGGWGEGCWEQEKLGLLQLKPFFNHQYDPFYFDNRYVLYNWVEDREGKESTDCCQWARVECDATSGRVIGLSLEDRLWEERAFLANPAHMQQWYLNASLFLPFNELKNLSLSGNRIAGCLRNEGFEKLTLKLKKLEILDLSYNYFNDSSILSSLVEFSSIKSLDLSNNRLSGPIHNTGFEGLSTKSSALEFIDLSGNKLDDNILVFLSEIPSIKHLDLSYNRIIGSTYISELNNLINLKELHLSGNEIKSLGSIQESNTLINLKELHLSGNEINSLGSLHGLINLEVLALTLDILNNSILSSLGPFSTCLKRLYIGGILEGSIDIKDARGLKSLESLDRVPAANNSVLLEQSLGLFPSLKTLYFESYGLINETLAVQELRNSTSLEELYVGYTFLHTRFLEDVGKLTSLRVLSLSGSSSGSLPIQGLLELKNLESLTMDEISLQDNFLEKIGAITSLKILSVSWCGLSGNFSTFADICQLMRLEELDVSDNNLKDGLPDCFSNLTLLRHLDLSSNKFSGNLAASPLQSLTSIEYLDLSNNHFQFPSSLKPFFNHSKLKYFNGDNNNIYAETELHSLAPQFQLNAISLSCCGDVGPTPKFLHHQHELQYVDLSNINMTGEFPSWLLENNTELERLFLRNNSLSDFQLPFHSPMNLLSLDVSNNLFDGHIPVEIGVCLPVLTFLNVSKNYLDGSIPTSIGDMKFLRALDLSNNRLSGVIPENLATGCSFLGFLDLSNNRLSGVIPENLATGCSFLEFLDLSNNRLSGVIPENLATGCSFLEFLDLSNNRLQGQIFSGNFNLTILSSLYLAGNNFTGSIPNSLSNCSMLSSIDIGFNHFSGRIPRWIGNLSLNEIIMPDNHIEGPIPMEFCRLDIGVLDLSMNNISGALPSCFSPSLINHLHLSKNRLRGPIPNGICKSSRLVTLDLSDNKLTGNIPNCIGKLSDLSYLLLRHNNLEGEIPNQFCQLDKLSLIDLSYNRLSGRIPNCLNVTAYEEVIGDSIDDAPPPSNAPSSIPPMSFETDGSIELTTKNISYSYKGRILRYLSGIDLSSNRLAGEIPQEMGNFQTIVMLNLSHNRLSGPIPPSLSNLKDIESLDLSYNNLSGSIPPQFVKLYSLAYFNVSYNNLSGNPPPRAAQFASDFDWNSYWGNPFLCGEPLPKSCSTMPNEPGEDEDEDENEGGDGLIDIESFFVTFTVSYVVMLLTVATVMYINPHWRRAWFFLIERGITFLLLFCHRHYPKQLCCSNI